MSDHSHDHSHDHDGVLHVHGSAGSLGTAFLLNVSFTLIELVGAWFTNSTAIAADAVHDLGDSLALAFAWGMERASRARPTRQFTFGFGRLSAAGALVNTGVIVAGSLFVMWEAVPRLFAPPEPDATGMLVLALLGVAVNGIAAWRAGGDSMNASVVRWHLMEDVLGWLAVLVGASVMHVVHLPVLDPLLSIGIALFVSVGAVRHGRRAAEVLLQGVPAGLDCQSIREALAEDGSVRTVEHFHLWSVDGSTHVVTAELVVDGDLTLSELTPVRERLRSRLAALGVGHTTLEFAVSARDGACGAP